MAAGKARHRRCAIYTRKSSEEGLEQAFNSLDAQREACASYVRSQAGEGWKALPARYDDGGFSGGSMERPALARLLEDVREGRVDIVVVYKVDRLTRALADFARIVELFDAHGVSFVSVTQQFNTTSSMGRLTLNMLLSFAQFEREVTGERIRDKIAASKTRGMWMGGVAPLGYAPDGRTLTIIENEAETVRTLYRLYQEHGTVRQVKAEADRLGLVTRGRPDKAGAARSGKPFTRGHIYRLLGNPIYAGRIAHKGKTFPGLHPPIMDPAIWDTVQLRLAENAARSRSDPRAERSPRLKGKLFDEQGEALTPTHTVKSGRRYRYYVSRAFLSGAQAAGDGWRLPAREIEQAVAQAVTGLLQDGPTLADAARRGSVPARQVPALLTRAAAWQGDWPDLVQRVDLATEEVMITLDLTSLGAAPDTRITHTVPLAIRRRGVERRLVLEAPGASPANPDPTLIKAVARGHAWFEELRSGRVRSLREVARSAGVTDRYVARHLPLAFLAPDIVESILAGTQPADLTAEKLLRGVDLPMEWVIQRSVLGFSDCTFP